MSIIRPFRADDLFRFNNMCVAFHPVSSHSNNSMSFRVHRLPFPAISTSGPKRCVTYTIRRAPCPCAPTPPNPTETPLSRPSIRASRSMMHACMHALILSLITHTHHTHTHKRTCAHDSMASAFISITSRDGPTCVVRPSTLAVD
jgi:hypothetical protein